MQYNKYLQGKGSKKDFSNCRGIFRVTILRSILDKLIYNNEYPNIDDHLTDSNVGAIRQRNIRDNIFVINAITNNIEKRNLKDIDINGYDAEKCFDKLFAKECFNDIFDNGFTNDKLPLLFKENINAKVAVKTLKGTTRPFTISEVIMQGTVTWASLFCTSTMDMLGKQVYNIPELLFDYKGVKVPPLRMVDEIITVTNLEQTKTTMNKLVNTFMEHKNLKLSQEKSYRINIGKGHLNCPKLQVHENEMKEADAEKYLGDVIDKSGKIQTTINKRLKRGEGIISEILSILSEISLVNIKQKQLSN